jgi:cell division protein FtsW (lipid II flippase)
MMKDWKFAIRFDPFVTLLTFIILTFGFAIFFSASLGVMARHEVKFYNIVQNQFIFGMLLGSLAFLAGAILPSKLFRNLSPVFFIFGIVLCLLVFVPGLGIEQGGIMKNMNLYYLVGETEYNAPDGYYYSKKEKGHVKMEENA